MNRLTKQQRRTGRKDNQKQKLQRRHLRQVKAAKQPTEPILDTSNLLDTAEPNVIPFYS